MTVSEFIETYITAIEDEDGCFLANCAWELLDNGEIEELSHILTDVGFNFRPFQISELISRIRYGVYQFKSSRYSSIELASFISKYLYGSCCGLTFDEVEDIVLTHTDDFKDIHIYRSPYTNSVIIMKPKN